MSGNKEVHTIVGAAIKVGGLIHFGSLPDLQRKRSRLIKKFRARREAPPTHKASLVKSSEESC
jgi:hypothetical protein